MNLYLHRSKAEIHLISFLLLLVYEIDFARTAFRTPTLKFGEPTPTAIEVFIIDAGCGVTTQYLVQYRIRGSSIIITATTGAENIYATRLTGLLPNTVYEIRARASQVNSITTVTESDAAFSSWNTTSTEPLSVFGSVVLNNVNYNGNTENSESWNVSLATIQNGYRDIRNLGISILRIEDNSGKARVHYRIKVLETELTVGDTKYELSGADFTDSYINSGDTPTGVALVYRSGDEWTLTYLPASSCSKIVERYMRVSADQGQPIGDIHLNVASSEVATADEHDGLRIGSDGNLYRDDDISVAKVPEGSVIGLVPRFLIKDCLTNQISVSLYSELFQGMNLTDGTIPVGDIFETIAPLPLSVSNGGVPSTSSLAGDSVTLSITSIERAVKYEVLDSVSNSVMAAFNVSESTCGDRTQEITVNSLTEGTEYNFTLQVTIRLKSGSLETSVFARNVTVIPESSTTTAAETTQAVTTATTQATTPAPTTTTTTTTITTTSPTTTPQPRGNKCLWNYHLSPCNKQFTQFHRCMESCDTWYSSWWTVRSCKSRCKCWLNEEIKTYRSKCCFYTSDDIYNRCYRFKDVLYYYNYNYGGRGYNYRYGGQLYNYNNRNYNYEGRKRNLQKKSHHNVAFALYRNYIYGGKRYNYNNRNYGGRGHNPQKSGHHNVRYNLYRRYY